MPDAKLISSTDQLAAQKCEACRSGVSNLGNAQKQKLLKALPGWAIVLESGVPQLLRQYSFPDFQKALDFACQVGALAEAENHHPQLTVEWGRVQVRWWTHSIHDLHLNDFILAARVEALAAS